MSSAGFSRGTNAKPLRSVPHYVVASKGLGASTIARTFSWVRRLLIEDFYRRLATMFPETAGWLGSADE